MTGGEASAGVGSHHADIEDFSSGGGWEGGNGADEAVACAVVGSGGSVEDRGDGVGGGPSGAGFRSAPEAAGGDEDLGGVEGIDGEGSGLDEAVAVVEHLSLADDGGVAEIGRSA